MLDAQFLPEGSPKGKAAQPHSQRADVPGEADQEQEDKSQVPQLWRTRPQQGPVPRYSCLYPSLREGSSILTQIEYLSSAREIMREHEKRVK